MMPVTRDEERGRPLSMFPRPGDGRAAPHRHLPSR